MSIIRVGLQDTGGLWHLKKWCHKKKIVQKLFLSPMTTFGKCIKKFDFYILPIIMYSKQCSNYPPVNHIILYIYWKRYVSYYLDPFPSLKMPFALEADYAINEAIWVTEISSSGKDTKLFCWIIRTELGKYIMQFLWQDSIECVGVKGPQWTDIWLPENSLIV